MIPSTEEGRVRFARTATDMAAKVALLILGVVGAILLATLAGLS